MYYYLFRLFMLRISLWHAFRIETESHTHTHTYYYCACILDEDVLYTKSSIFSLTLYARCFFFSLLHLRFPYFVNMCFLNYLIDITINVGISPRTMYHLTSSPSTNPSNVRSSMPSSQSANRFKKMQRLTQSYYLCSFNWASG